jgi:hypothetical protein
MVLSMIRTAWKQRCDGEGDWYLTPLQRYWLTFKFTLCMLLSLNGYPDPTWSNEHVCVAITDSCSFPCEWGTCYSWTGWHVGKGLFKNWWFYSETDGTP